MKPITLNQIDTFLKHKSFVMYGVSSTKTKMGNHIFKELTNIGITVYPIHKELETIENKKCYANVYELPEQVEAAIICTKTEKTALLLDELKKYGITQVWLQQGSAKHTVIQKANELFTNVIYGKCIMMFANQTGMHKFHSNILRFFRKYPTAV